MNEAGSEITSKVTGGEMYMSQSELEMVCSGLLNDLSGVLTWKWDDRFGALLTQFQVEGQEEVRRVLDRHFDHLWDQKSIRQAPRAIKEGVEDFRELRNNQLLFTSDPANGSLLFAAWWPWGDAKSISVRVASVVPGQAPRRTGLLGKVLQFFN